MIVFCHPKEVIKDRSEAIRLDFRKRYDCDVLRQELFDEQSGLCRACEKAIASPDSILVGIDHAVSVWLYASWDLSIADACKFANDRKNLVLLHTECNSVKNSRDLEEFLEQITEGKVVLGEPKVWAAEDFERQRQKIFEYSAKGGRASGRVSVETGRLASLRTKEHQAKAGRIGGQKAVESGQLARILELPQSIAARKKNGRKAGRIRGRQAVESGELARIRELPQSKAAQRESGRKYGRENGHKNVESGQFARMMELPQTKAAQKANGRKLAENGHFARISELPQSIAARKKNGRKAVESGQLASICSKGGWVGSHIRWHVKPNKPSIRCAFCSEENLVFAFA